MYPYLRINGQSADLICEGCVVLHTSSIFQGFFVITLVYWAFNMQMPVWCKRTLSFIAFAMKLDVKLPQTGISLKKNYLKK